MKNFFTKLRLGFIASIVLLAASTFAQTKIAGKVSDGGTKETLIGVSIAVKGKVIGTITDSKGNFSLSTTTAPPFVILVSSVGYQSQEFTVTESKTDFDIKLAEQTILGQEVVVSASRIEESVMKSPVSVEKMDIRAIQSTPSASFYDGLANLKGIDMTTQGLLFKSINMRGFGSTGNPRIVQMIDGMDNQAPGLNFAVDNIIGMPELDVENVEVLPGAASALYGPNAINGLVLMNSKSPFLYQGLSASVKAGVMSASNRTEATTPLGDFSIRYAKAFNNKLAFKMNFSYVKATDWQSTNYTNLNIGGKADPTRGLGTNTDYDGMNSYGDEIQANLNSLNAALPKVNVSRTGYLEKDLVDYNTKSLKFNAALHYRLSEKVEAIAQLNYGEGTTVYTGTGKYSLRNFAITQAKLELRGDNFTIRGYTTQERSGDSYVAGLTAVGMLQEIKSNKQWFTEYAGTFGAALATGSTQEQADLAARKVADANMPAPGSTAFNNLLNKYRTTTITNGGGLFGDASNMYHLEGIYNFKNQIKFVDFIVGANYRNYQLRSNGTLFADTPNSKTSTTDPKYARTGTIGIEEYGAFAQVSKSLFDNHVKLSGSLRYDKNQNFEGQFTPRISAVTTFGEHNIRLSYQTGFRIPTTQNQYIDLRTPSGTLIGGLPEFDARYNLATGVTRDVLEDFSKNPAKYVTADVLAKAKAYATAAVTAQLPAIQAGVLAAVTAQVTAGVTAQVNAAVAAGQIPAANAAAAISQGVATTLASPAIQATISSNVTATLTQKITETATQVAPAYALATLPKYQAKALQPEKIQSYEIGYKTLIAKRLFVDASYYMSIYKNFLGGTSIVVPTAALAPGLPIESGLASATTREGYQRPANSTEDITISGWGLGLTYSLAKGYNLGANITNNTLSDFKVSSEVPYAGFNSPKYTYKFSFGKRIISGSNWGYNVSFRHQDAFTWESSFPVPTTSGVALFTNTEVPTINNFDAQFSYKVPSIKSIIKVGGTNLFGNPYIQAYGSASVGSSYYVSIVFDELLNK
ncbi:TonB-dependent receptor [Arcicella sp. LKC2W]|uniref:TonB-dependent receptor domain-containing protein n=1 Tax=Arcicella sp. LKC2W TaxID=2984198 RepID=UPI002B20388D|nr:TonB-dependent receptor [Arcicella sp. LKC2W]MEA5457823.1 TonB-dependent receptor [Arcicella sp. LKC2W]